jgi:hypothetical protein
VTLNTATPNALYTGYRHTQQQRDTHTKMIPMLIRSQCPTDDNELLRRPSTRSTACCPPAPAATTQAVQSPNQQARQRPNEDYARTHRHRDSEAKTTATKPANNDYAIWRPYPKRSAVAKHTHVALDELRRWLHAHASVDEVDGLVLVGVVMLLLHLRNLLLALRVGCA